MIKRGAVGVGAAVLSAAVLCAAVAILIQHEMLPEGAIETAAMIIGGLTVFVSDWIVVKQIPQSRLPAAMAMGAGYVIILFLFKLALFPAAAPINRWSIVIPFIASAIAGILGSRKQKRRR